MTKKLLFVGFVLLTLAMLVMAADAVTGTWKIEQAGRGGGPPRVSTLELKADGAKLTGKITMPGFGRGGDTPPPPTTTEITNGKVEGNNVSFDVARETPNGSMTTKYAGTVNGSEMALKITSNFGGQERVQEATAKKQ